MWRSVPVLLVRSSLVKLRKSLKSGLDLSTPHRSQLSPAMGIPKFSPCKIDRTRVWKDKGGVSMSKLPAQNKRNQIVKLFFRTGDSHGYEVPIHGQRGDLSNLTLKLSEISISNQHSFDTHTRRDMNRISCCLSPQGLWSCHIEGPTAGSQKAVKIRYNLSGRLNMVS